MGLSAERLKTYFLNVSLGVGPTPDKQAVLDTLALQATPEVRALTIIGTLVNDSTAVAALSYAYFGKTLPSAEGLAYLVHGPSSTDLSDPYYATFNQENRFLNFSLNLAVGPASPYAANFAATYGALSYADTVDVAYEAIVSSANAQARNASPVIAKRILLGALPFYEAVVQERAGLKPTDAGYSLAVKAALVSGVLNASVNAGIGQYYDAYAKLLTDLEYDASPRLGRELLTAYPAYGSGHVFTANTAGFNTGDATTSVQGVTTSDLPDTININAERLAGSIIDGRGQPVGSDGDTLYIYQPMTGPVTIDDGGAGGQISNVESLVILQASSGLITGPTVEGSGVTQILFTNPVRFALASSGQTITVTGSSTILVDSIYSDVVLIGGGTIVFAPGARLTGASSFAGFNVDDVRGDMPWTDSLIAAGGNLSYRVTGPSSVAALSFALETNGSLDFNMGLGGGVVEATNNTVTDIFRLPAGHAASTIDFANGSAAFVGDTIANLSISTGQFLFIRNLDQIDGFDPAIDRIDLPKAVGAVIRDAGLFTASPLELNARLGPLAVGDVVLLASASSPNALLIQNLSGSDIDGGDLIIQLAGVVGGAASLSAANFI